MPLLDSSGSLFNSGFYVLFFFKFFFDSEDENEERKNENREERSKPGDTSELNSGLWMHLVESIVRNDVTAGRTLITRLH